MSYCLHVAIEGMPHLRASYELDTEEAVLIGRSSEADVHVDLPEVSSSHAMLRFDPERGSFVIQDLNSKQGTFVNSNRVEPGVLCPIALDESFQIGRAYLRVKTAEASDAGAEAVLCDTARINREIVSRLGGEIPVLEAPDSEPIVPIEVAKTVMGAPMAAIADKLQSEAEAGGGPAEPNLSVEVQDILLQRVDLAKVVQQASDDEHARQIVREQIGYVVNDLFHKGRIREEQVDKVQKDAFDDILGFGPIQDMIDSHDISEIMVNRPDQIYYEERGKLKIATRSFQSDDHVQQILRRLLRDSQRRIDEATPMVNATLADGSRLHAIIPPIALNGSKITIRKFHENLAVSKLIEFGALTKPMGDFIQLATSERQNMIVSGGTGSGKTTLLNCLSSFIPEDQRVITIEDTAELSLAQPHVVRLQARPANTEGIGLVTIQDLVVEALRMRPDRIIVGECRHAEALDMLQAMNTGHDGSLTTVHSNSAADALARLETMVLLSGLDLPMSAIREQIRSAVNFIVHASRLVDGSRKIVEIIEITGMEEGRILTQPVYLFEQEGLTEEGRVIGKHRPTGYIPSFLNVMRQQGKEIPPGLFAV